MQTWSMSYSKGGTTIDLHEVPLWAMLVTEAGGWLLAATHPVFCCYPEWADRLAWAPPSPDEPVDEEGWAYNSHTLGHVLHSVSTQLISGFGAFRKYKTKVRIPVTPEWVREHFPDAGWPFDGSSGDEMRSDPEDNGDVQL